MSQPTSFPVVVAALWAEGRGRPDFLATGTPALSWQVQTDAPGWLQHSYELETRVGSAVLGERRQTVHSQHQPWPAEPLGAYEAAAVRVRVTGTDGSVSEFSPWVELKTGPLSPADWAAPFIAGADGDAAPAGNESDPDDRGTTRFRTDLTAGPGLVSAVLSATAHGIYQAVINGQVVGDEVLTPGWTSYDDRLTFQSYDVTGLIRAGQNVLGATVADGWYRERFGFDGNFQQGYPGPRALSLQVRLEYADGRVDTVVTDDSWTASGTGPVTRAGIYPGESFDARLDDAALADPGTALPHPLPVIVLGADVADPARLTPSFAPPVRRIEHVAVQSVTTSPTGATLLDFGQNLVGWLELSLDAPAGHTVTLRHAEVLENGELGVRPLRFAEATDHFTGDGAGRRTWSPAFTFHGFRYAEVSGWPGGIAAITPESLVAVVVSSDLRRIGHFESSVPDLNQLHQNVVWGMRGNFVDVPTDCPQRDERLGWTGDIAAFTPSAAFLYDSKAFLADWLVDLGLEQEHQDGVVPFVVPDILKMVGIPDMFAPVDSTAVWSDAAVWVPWSLWEAYGDTAVLENQYDSMTSHVRRVAGILSPAGLWDTGFQFGDWLDPDAPPEHAADAKADPHVVATACIYRSTVMVADTAALLGRDDDAAEFRALAAHIREAFNAAYVHDGRITSDCTTVYTLAIVFGLLDAADLRSAGDRLAELVAESGFRISTGFAGTPFIMDALSSTGHLEEAGRLLLQRECPSWLYPVTMGATTIWERWDSMLPDGSINPGEMTSFNHYALGAVADWMHRVLGGLAPLEPGYRSILIAPQPVEGVDWVATSLDTPHGLVSVRWDRTAGGLTLRVAVPEGATATIRVGSFERVVEAGEHVLEDLALV